MVTALSSYLYRIVQIFDYLLKRITLRGHNIVEPAGPCHLIEGTADQINCRVLSTYSFICHGTLTKRQ